MIRFNSEQLESKNAIGIVMETISADNTIIFLKTEPVKKSVIFI